MTEQAKSIPDDIVDYHLDRVLSASGSGLRHYSMEKTKADMRRAMRIAMEQGNGKTQEA